jgi:hypothetical protein
MEAVRIAQDFGLAWEKARPEPHHEMLGFSFGSVIIGRNRRVSFKREDVALRAQVCFI